MNIFLEILEQLLFSDNLKGNFERFLIYLINLQSRGYNDKNLL